MNDRILRAELDRVSERYRILFRSLGLILLWSVLGLAGMAALRWLRGADWQPAAWGAGILALLGLALVPWLIVALRRTRDPLWLARRIERRHPDLDARLLAALEQRPDKVAGLGFLQQMVIDQAVAHARGRRWVELVPAGKLRMVRLANWGMFVVLVAVAAGLVVELGSRGVSGPARRVMPEASFAIKVEPEDTSVERGTALLVLARFDNSRVPGEVELLYRDGSSATQPIQMSKSLDDPLFATRIASVKRDGTYAVRYGNSETRWYTVSVFDYPQLRQADARLKFPEYTGLDEKVVQDTRSVTGVEGTHVTFTFHLNKPVAEARLVPTRRPAEAASAAGVPGSAAPVAASAPAGPLALSVDPADPTAYTLALDLKQSQVYQLQLVDAERRANRDQPQMTINVTVNRPPDLKVLAPNRDLDVSALEEITVRAQVWDDFGVKRVGMTYAIAGQEPKDVILAENVPGKERRDVSEIISLEKLGAEPDQLLSYHLWAEDIGPDGKTRRTEGAMYFADVRPFEEIYRQGEALAAGQEDQQQQRQQQQQQQGQQGGQNAQRADQVANTLKQIIAATWNIQRRETAPAPSPQFVPDVTAVESSQTQVRQQAEGLADQLTDDRSLAYLSSGVKNMDTALEQLKTAESTPTVKPLPGALSAEQAAYQDLLKLRAREFEVTRSNRQQQQSGQSAAQQRRQQQVNQMNLANQNNPYQMRRNAQQQPQQPQEPQQETDAQRETRQVLSRLRDLAQRQDDLNRQMQEMQSALQQAQTQEQRDEIQRQLANLREQQQQQLRDADELRDRMDQPQNQEQMAEARQQLDQTRDAIQQAAQNLNNGQMQQAAAAGQRASEQLNNLQNQMRRAAAGQFGQAMTQMREDAQNLERNQQQIDQGLANLNQPAQTAPTGLRDVSEQAASQGRQQVAQDLQQQRQQLQNLLDNMQQTIEQADAPQPLLSRQLYDTYRQTQQQQPDRALDTSRQLVQQGLLQEARQTNGEASQTITRLREGVDQAASGVLGDETDALRKARNELDALAQQLDREMGQAAAQAATQPGRGGARGALANATQNATQPNERQIAGNATQPGTRRGAVVGTQPGDRQLAQTNPQGQRGGQQAGRGGSPNGQPDTQPQDRQLVRGQSPNGNQAQQPPQPGQRGGQQPGPQGQQPGGQAQDPQLAQGARGGPGLRAPGQPNGAQGRAGGRGQPGDATQPGEYQIAASQPGDRQPGPRPDQTETQPGRGNPNGRGAQLAGPITGNGFRDFTDSLRSVEELVNDPLLRAQAANIRQNATNLRANYVRGGSVARPPAWDILQETLNRPLADLRNAISQEIQRRESAQPAVPLDKDAVPPAYQDQVRAYYERLGSGQ